MYTLLIVDDEYIVRKGIRELIDFTSLGIDKVLEGKNGQEALALMKDQQVDLALVDINMPKMNGLQFAEAAKNLNGELCLAIITGYDYFDYAQAAIKIGVEDYVLKPITKSDVEQVIKKLVTIAARKRELAAIKKALQQEEQEKYSGYKAALHRTFSEHYLEDDFSLSKLSLEVGLSATYVSQLFHQLFGVPFQEYLLEKRLAQSKLLLLGTDLKTYEIAQRVGISDPNYFSTRFRKHYGLSPTQYRKETKDDWS